MICPKCGKEVSDAIPFCELCGATLPKQQKEDCAFEGEHEHLQEIDNAPKPLMGFLGAMLGAAVSCVLMALLPRIGMKPSVGALAIAFFVFMGSGLLNKNRTKIGFGVCIMFIIFTPYIADRLNWAIWMVNNAKLLQLDGSITVLEAFLGMPILLDAGKIDLDSYYLELFNSYIFTAIGAVAYLAGVARARKKMQTKMP